MKDLQNIKDEVAECDNFYNWDDLFACCAMYDYGRLEWAIDQVAIRYAQEQKRELVEMLEITRQMCIKRQFPSENELKEIASKIEKLITKHKQS